MLIRLLHQAVAPGAAADERDVLDQAAAVAAALGRLGHDVRVRPVTLDLESLRRDLRQTPPEAVFNLVESLGGADRLLPCVPMLLESLGIPCSGSPADALYLTTHKLLAKRRLRAAGLPTPDWIAPGETEETPAAPAERKGWLLKSVWDHASAGVRAANLLRDAGRAEAARRLAELAAEAGGEWFAESYVEGREFNLALLEDTEGKAAALPPAEMLFVDFPPDKPRILDYEAKWNPSSFACLHTRRSFDLPAADAPLLERLRRLALACWRIFGLRGHARVDFRVDAAGEPWILEINANPCLAPDAGFAAALQAAGIGYDEAIARILAAARRRPPPARPAPGRTGTSPAARQETPARGPGVVDETLRYRREVTAADMTRIRDLATATGFFDEAEVRVAVELVEERLRLGAASGYEFLLAETPAGELAGYSCFGPTPCTKTSFDLYWIAVAPPLQKQGLGRRLARMTERLVREMGGSRIYAETSGRPQYAATRAFYERCGYRLASFLDDFYAPGDGKATFVRILDPPDNG
jgi:D-alanine-D-alanine ligase